MSERHTYSESKEINRDILILWRAGRTNQETADLLSIGRDNVIGRKRRLGCTNDRHMSEELRLKLVEERRIEDSIRNSKRHKAELKAIRSTRTRYDKSAPPIEKPAPRRYPVISAAQAIGRPLITQHWT